MEGIRFISKHMVRPKKINDKTLERVELTSWDIKLLLLGPIQKGIFFPKPTSLQEKELFADDVVEHLNSSLARVLEYFYPLSGRLCVVQHEDDTSSFFIDCNNKGAYFVYAVVDNIRVSDILDSVYTPPIVQSFFPISEVLNIEGDSNPLLAVQVNELVDGFFIGCSMNHSVGDGSSFWHFFNSWSEMSRGLHIISRLPAFLRWFPGEINCPLRVPSSACSIPEDKIDLPPLIERVFHFPKEIIANLKAKANTEMNTSNLSSLQALLAHLWQSVIRCQELDFDLEVSFVLVVGVRSRMHSLIEENYFGNAIIGFPLKTKVDDLLNLGLGKMASQMHQVIASTTSDVIASNIINWTKDPKINKLSLLMNNALFPSSSPRFNVYGTDFGWGRPVAVRSGSANKSDGKITLFPGVEQGSIDVEVCSSPEKLNALGNDFEFMETVAI